MNEPHETVRETSDENPELSADLTAAIARAQAIAASPEIVARLAGRVIAQTSQVNHRPLAADKAKNRWQWIAAIAASLVLAGAINLHNPIQHELVVRRSPETTEHATAEHLPIRSAVVTVSLADVGYQRILEDLDHADARVARASEEVALAAVRQEIEDTLDEFYNWSL